ncbi:MAG: protein kinase, partial [Lachnospiraceae bacterium]|nr:protein kinase [Lachnospiraceae bacterium]
MDSRTALKNGTSLLVTNSDGGTVIYTILNEIGRGGSSIVYDANYTNNLNKEKKVRIKECFPFKLSLKRDEAGNVIVNNQSEKEFIKCKNRFMADFKAFDDISSMTGLINSSVSSVDIYSLNNTYYIVSVFSEGQTLKFNPDRSLKDTISLVITIAKTINKIHDKGYLYLDLKPDNVFVLDEVTDLVKLFDFDSLFKLSDLSSLNENLRISYTKGFSAPELAYGNPNKLGVYTDVYSLGALLYYLLFNEIPSSFECEKNANYDFLSMKYDVEDYYSELVKLLTTFFHKTISNYIPDRFNQMEDAIALLNKLLDASDLNKPYIISANITKPRAFYGRNEELDKLVSNLTNSNAPIFVTGMGGIGKSTIVKQAISDIYGIYDSTIYVYEKNSLFETIADDKQLRINSLIKTEEESIYDYASRKLNKLYELAIDSKILFVVDDFTGDFDDQFNELIKLPVKLVFISRKNVDKSNFDSIQIKEIKSEDALIKLFENSVRKSLSEEEYIDLQEIISLTFSHTLSIELIAKQIANSFISVAKAKELLKANGISNIANEKIDYQKDDNYRYDTIYDIVNSLFDTAFEKGISKAEIKVLSLIDHKGIDIDLYQQMLGLKTKDVFVDLKKAGFIEVYDNIISLHPIIRDSLKQLEWEEDSLLYLKNMLSFLNEKLSYSNRDLEFPESIIKVNEIVKESGSVLSRIFEKKKDNALEDIYIDRVRDNTNSYKNDKATLNSYLSLAEDVLNDCKEIEPVRKLDIYADLLY